MAAMMSESFIAPDVVNEYTTSQYAGVVQVELTYYTTAECVDENAAKKTETQMITVE